MVLPSTGAISFNDMRTEFGLTGPISLADVRGWTTSYNQWSNAVAMDTYRGKTYTTYRYPPASIGQATTWRKSETANRTVVYNGTSYTGPREQVKRIYDQSEVYGTGIYKVYTSASWYYYNDALGTAYGTYEWPASGAFDGTVANSTTPQPGFSSGTADWYSTSDHTPLVLGIDLPFAITPRNYTVQIRNDGSIDQSPTKWILLGSNDLSTWATVDSRSGITWSSLGQTQTLTISGLNKYKYWRIVLLRNNGTAINVTVGEIALNAPEYMKTASWSYSSPTNPVLYTTTPLLDQLSSTANIKGAWGTRLLRQGYTGPIFTVRRSTDNATTNVYVTIDFVAYTDATYTTTLRSWLGTATAYISTWYDQSGAGNHATQSTTSTQAYITVDTGSGISYVTFPTGAYMNLPNGTLPANNGQYTIFAHHGTINNVAGHFVSSGNGANNQALSVRRDYTGYVNYWWNVDSFMGGYANGNRVTFTYDGSNVKGYTNSGILSKTARSNRASASTSNYIGRGILANEELQGQLYTIVVFERVISEADRLILES